MDKFFGSLDMISESPGMIYVPFDMTCEALGMFSESLGMFYESLGMFQISLGIPRDSNK